MPTNKKKKGRKRSGAKGRVPQPNGAAASAASRKIKPQDLPPPPSSSSSAPDPPRQYTDSCGLGTVQNFHPTEEISPGASCWICLEDGPPSDVNAGSPGSGELPRRDCSCRGDAAGYAHLACLIQYASTRSDAEWSRRKDGFSFTRPWEVCPTCEQQYQGHLALQLAEEFTRTTSDLEGFDCYRHLVARQSQITRLSRVDEHQLALRLAEDALIQMRAGVFTLREAGMTVEASRSLLADALRSVGVCVMYCAMDAGDSSINTDRAFQAFSEAREIYVDIGSEDMVTIIDAKVAQYKHSVEIGEEDPMAYLGGQQDAYQHHIRLNGKDNLDTIIQATKTVHAYTLSEQFFDGYDLLCETFRTVRRVYGPNHSMAKRCLELLPLLNVRMGFVIPDGNNMPMFQPVYILSYDEDSKEYLASSYGSDVRNNEGHRLVPASWLMLRKNTPVYCENLISAGHLNGKTGVMKDYNEQSGRYIISFQDKDIKPCLVKRENVRVLYFDDL